MTGSSPYHYKSPSLSNTHTHTHTHVQSSKPNGVIHMLQCYRMFDGKTKGIQMSYCCGLEVGESTYYLKAESASSFSEWVKVCDKQLTNRVCVLSPINLKSKACVYRLPFTGTVLINYHPKIFVLN